MEFKTKTDETFEISCVVICNNVCFTRNKLYSEIVKSCDCSRQAEVVEKKIAQNTDGSNKTEP